ncbi:MAG TPA: LON peptidase substrate-binding domain-containing protein [Tenuifilaceae bacterium]|nr:LON peptidase substrate-binding domain-containing protein [Tenuifilaceae bacterium]HRX66882.1 LON peptidase substrate-binding domain-containing protein [Tenuifilaceae bacterium]
MNPNVSNIAMFPLNVFVFPGEEIPLRIFEPRYKQLINECRENLFPFAIPFINGSSISNYGSKVELLEVIAENSLGDMVIMIRGLSLFKVIEFTPQLPTKLYGGGIIETLTTDFTTTNSELAVLVKRLKLDLHKNLGTLVIDSSINMLDIGKALMLKPEERFKLITMKTNDDREHYLINQLRFVEFIRNQETKLENNFQLN